jgi:menaquinone-9 beta-reductase
VPGTDYDVVIVGARVAGASLATHLARAGMRVAVLDRASFPSDTMSTHVVYPNTIARLERLDALDEILAHTPPPLYTVWHHAGEAFTAPHTSEAGRDWALCVRRITLDKILVDRARAAGADVHERFRVTGLVGAGTQDDPVAGIVGELDGTHRELRAPLVVGADGVRSTVARLVGAEPHTIMPSATMMLYAYWRGLPARNCQEFFFEPPWIGTHFPADDGFHLVVLIGPVGEFDVRTKDRLYGERISSLATLGDRVRRGTRASGVIGTARLDGYYRPAAGPGWLLTGDAGHFKHPAIVQGIADALRASEVLAPMVSEGTQRERFEPWRDTETRELYAFSRFAGGIPAPAGMSEIMGAAIADAGVARGIVDIWSSAQRPWQVMARVPAMLEATGESPESVLASLPDRRSASVAA